MDIKKLDSIIKAVANKNINEVNISDRAAKLHFSSTDFFKSKRALKKEKNAVKGSLDINTESIPESAFANHSHTGGGENDICSDTIGFFSRTDKKTKKQYVKLRDVIKKGDVIGVVTSMHVEHDILADKGGKVTEVLVEEGQPVEYGQPLIRLEKK